jgi:hypothetical protein
LVSQHPDHRWLHLDRLSRGSATGTNFGDVHVPTRAFLGAGFSLEATEQRGTTIFGAAERDIHTRETRFVGGLDHYDVPRGRGLSIYGVVGRQQMGRRGALQTTLAA